MSDEKEDNIVKMFPDFTKPETFGKEKEDEILIDGRDEMLEFIEGVRGRIMSFDIRGIVMIGMCENPTQDIVFQSGSCLIDVARTVGSLEFVKQSIVDKRLRDIEEYE